MLGTIRTPAAAPFWIITGTLTACGAAELTEVRQGAYSFFVAGHTYGEPGIDNDGLSYFRKLWIGGMRKAAYPFV